MAVKTGPQPFMWSLDFSLDSNYLSIACWSGRANVYQLSIARLRWRRAVRRVSIIIWRPLLGRERLMQEVLKETAVITRKNRIYSVAMSTVRRRHSNSRCPLCVAALPTA